MTVTQLSSLIEASVEETWAIVSAFSAIKSWMPSVDSCIASGNTIGSVRTIRLGEMTVQEQLDTVDDGNHIISYQILDSPNLPARGLVGTICLDSPDDHHTHLTWTAEARDVLPEVGEEGKQFLQALFNQFISASIEGLKVALEPAKVKLG